MTIKNVAKIQYLKFSPKKVNKMFRYVYSPFSGTRCKKGGNGKKGKGKQVHRN